ncbi:MAG: T9SS type A sorting domain-containing protein, partial [Bacteroidota bacterium]|nr:T9SS type A sorting domain-containing protein [Bacteroidota bacterium]
MKVKLVYTYRADQPGATPRVSTSRAVPPPTYATDTRESWFDLTVFSVAVATRYAAGFDTDFAPVLFGANYSSHQGGKISVRFGQGHTSITKPFIVVEGYNTTHIAPHLVGQNNQNNTVGDFLISIDRDFGTTGNFNDALQQAGYDLIYIDFTDGAADIRNNAALFEEVVRWVNTAKLSSGSTEQNVVMGESMGGLIARYGLARLVRNGYNPQTRLLVLHDSPQRGAYNPMGVQALTRQAEFPVALLPGAPNNGSGGGIVHTSDLSDKLAEALVILDAPATRQLSLQNVTGINDEYENNTFIEGPYKDMIDFSDIGGTPAGFPVIIATSVGSQCGRPQNTSPSQELTVNSQDYILGFSYIVRTGIQSEGFAYALPAYGTQSTIARLRVWSTLRVLWAKYDVNLVERAYTSPANTLPYETLPGGNINLHDQLDVAGNYSRNFIGFWRFASNTTFYNGDICFVPSYSALDVPTVSSATAFSKYINGVTDNPSIPRVARFIAMESSGSTFNQSHLRFTARNSEWIFNEMQRPAGSTAPNLVGCSTECTLNSIVNSNGAGQPVCSGSSATFSLSGNVTGNITWTSFPMGFLVPSNGTGPYFTTVGGAGHSGDVTIIATNAQGCELARDVVHIGPPVQPDISLVDDGTCNDVANYHITNFNPTQTYTITNRVFASGSYRGSEYFYVKGGSGVLTGSFTLTATNNCGAASRNNSVSYPQCAGLSATATLYPNPANETVDVHIDNPEAAQPVTVRLFDGYGQLRAEQVSRGEATLRLKTDQLPAGLY